MAIRFQKHELSRRNRLRRALYGVLRDQLDIYLIKYALIDSYWRFRRASEPYPFVEKRELKPRARVSQREFSKQNSFLVIFCEGTLAREHRKCFRFFESNKTTKAAINEIADIKLSIDYVKNLRFFDNPKFEPLLLGLLPVDYALLIQQDPSVKRKNRYVLSHFHVKIDWPIDEATEAMAKQLRYISKSLYENGDDYAQALQQKLFEKYGFHHTVGGRRTAAVVASQFLDKMDFISTVYVSSSEARSLTRISEQGVTKFVLLKVTAPDIARMSDRIGVNPEVFEKQFLVDKQEDYGVCIFQVVYINAEIAKPPQHKELRNLQPDY
ncbi:MAG: hypothetical protein PVH02_03635 [Desulfobacteraceae bacterium]|jgi:hypothetical protein